MDRRVLTAEEELRDVSAFIANFLPFCESSDWAHSLERYSAGKNRSGEVVIYARVHCAITNETFDISWSWKLRNKTHPFKTLLTIHCTGCDIMFTVSRPPCGFMVGQQLKKNHDELMARLKSIQNVADVVSAFTEEKNSGTSILKDEE